MLRYAVKININKHVQSWDLRVDFFKSDVFMKTSFFLLKFVIFKSENKLRKLDPNINRAEVGA